MTLKKKITRLEHYNLCLRMYNAGLNDTWEAVVDELIEDSWINLKK